MRDTYEEMGDLRLAIAELYPWLDGICTSSQSLHPVGPRDLRVGENADTTISIMDHPLLREPRILKFASFFVRRAFDRSGEYGLHRLQWYMGIITQGEQFVTYLHRDSRVDERMTVAASYNPDGKCISASTRLTVRDFVFSNHFPNHDPEAIENKIPFESIPNSLLEPPTPEGTIQSFARTRYHVEQPLPSLTAKLFFAADINYNK